MKIAFFGAGGKTGSAVAARLVAAGHDVRAIELGDEPDASGCENAASPPLRPGLSWFLTR